MNNYVKKQIEYLRDIIKKNIIVKYILQFVFNILFYGLMLNMVLFSIFNFKFGFNTIIALGIIFYFIKVELPVILKDCLNFKNKEG